MFSLFTTSAFTDPTLGEFRRSRGLWRGTMTLAGGALPLALSGPRTAPDPQAIRIAQRTAADFAACRAEIEQALFEHYSPYAESIAAGEDDPPAVDFPDIKSPSSVWPAVTLEYVQVTPLDGDLAAEIGCRVTWDEEHTLGIRLRDGKLLGLCGSVFAF